MAVLTLGSCRTNDAGKTVPDWPVIVQELELTSADLTALANVAEDPELSATLNEIAGLTAQVAAAIEAGLPPGEPLDALQAALVLAGGLVDRLPAEMRADAQLALFVAGVVARRVEMYAK
jgi:hypothetical protein